MSVLYRYALLLLVFSTVNCQKKEALPPETPAPGTSQTNISLIEDRVNETDVLVVGDSKLEFYAAFKKPNLPGVSFQPVQDKLPVILEDSRGNRFNIWGEAVTGPDAGTQLEPATAMMAYWFAWGAMYPGCELYGHAGVDAPVQPPGDNDWLIPYSRLNQGALPGAIPSIDNPVYVEREIDFMPYLDDETLCLVTQIGGDVYVYPHPVMEWHEVVNDTKAGMPVSVMYCPLTGSGNVWLREHKGQELEFEVSGLLYNGNLIVKERLSGSYWSQLRNRAVAGVYKGTKPNGLQVLEMPLASARKLFKRFKLLSDRTEFNFEYGNFPCGDYCTNHDLILYSLDFDDPRVPRKERTFGVLAGGKAKVYRQSAFQ